MMVVDHWPYYHRPMLGDDDDGPSLMVTMMMEITMMMVVGHRPYYHRPFIGIGHRLPERSIINHRPLEHRQMPELIHRSEGDIIVNIYWRCILLTSTIIVPFLKILKYPFEACELVVIVSTFTAGPVQRASVIRRSSAGVLPGGGSSRQVWNLPGAVSNLKI